MICKNCGAELQEDVRSCPFCGADNFEQSLKEHQDTVNDSNRRAYSVSYTHLTLPTKA